MISRPALAPLLAAPLGLLAAPARAAADPAVAGSIGQMLLGLGIVVALLLATLWVLKRVAQPRGAAAGLRVLGAAPVGPRERVVLVEVGDKVLVLGVAPGSVRTLHTVAAAELAAGSAVTPPAAGGKDFPAWLRQALERKRNG